MLDISWTHWMHRSYTGLKPQHNPWLFFPTLLLQRALSSTGRCWSFCAPHLAVRPLPCWHTSLPCLEVGRLLLFSVGYLFTFVYVSPGESYNLSFVETGTERSFFCASHRPQGCCDSSGHVHTSWGPAVQSSWLMLVHAGPSQPRGVWRQWLSKEQSRAVLPASCQPSQTLSLVALGIHFSWDTAAVSVHWCRWAFTLCQGLAGVAELGPPEERTHKEWFSCLCPEVPFAFVDRGVVSDRNRLRGEQEPDVDPAEAAAAWHGPVPGGAAHLHPGAALLP